MIIREKISIKTTHRPNISPLSPLLNGIINFVKRYKNAQPNIMVISMAGNPVGTIQSIQKIPHKKIVLSFTFFRCFVRPACFDRSQ